MTKIFISLIFITFISCLSFSQTAICLDAVDQLTGTGNPALVDPWVSSDETIVFADTDGTIYGVAVGTCIVTYTDEFGTTTDFTVIVEEPLNTTPFLTSAPGTDSQSLDFDNLSGGQYFYFPLDDIIYEVEPGVTISLDPSSSLPLGVTSSIIGNTLTISGTPYTNNPITNPIVFSYTVVGTGVNSCTGSFTGFSGTTYNNSSSSSASGTVTLTVPCATSIDGNNTTINLCSNQPFGQGYNLTNGATSASVSGTNSFSINGNSVNISGFAPQTIVITTNGHCLNNTRTFTANEIFAFTSLTINSNQTQTICEGSPIQPITLDFAELLQNPVLPAGLLITYNGFSATITGTPTGTGNLNFSLTAVSQNCGLSETKNLSINVLTAPSVPTITADGPLTFCSGGSVNLTSSASNGNTWSDATTNQSINVTSSGSYTVSITNGTCSSTSNPVNVTVNNQSVISQGNTSNPAGCGSTSGSIEILGTDSGTLNWTGTTTGSLTVTLPFVVQNLPEGTYNFILTNACDSDTLSVTLTDQGITPQTPTIAINGNLTFCSGESLVLTSSSAINNIWSNQNTNQDITVTSSGNYFVLVNDNGCIASSDTLIVIVNQTPSKPIISVNGQTTLCPGETVTLSSSSQLNNTWSNNNTNQTITVSNAGQYFVTVTNNGCSRNSDTIQITPKQGPQKPFIFTDSSFTFCEGGQVNLTTNALSNFVWSTGSTSNSILVNTTQSITVSVTQNGCTTISDTLHVVSNPNPIVTISPINDFCNTILAFTPTNASPAGGNYSVNGIPTTSIIPASLLGQNLLSYSYTDNNGCSGINATIFNVIDCLSLEENSEFLIELYPNPTSGIVHLKGEKLNQVSNIEIRDQLGRIVHVIKNDATEVVFDLSDLSKGVYTLILKGNQIIETRQIQKID